MTLRPCLVCGEPADAPRCPDHTDRETVRLSTTARGYNQAWRVLSERARSLQPFCTDCGATVDLTTDHTPAAWQRYQRGLAIRLRDIDVVCRSCNSKRGAARGETTRPEAVPDPLVRPNSCLTPRFTPRPS